MGTKMSDATLLPAADTLATEPMMIREVVTRLWCDTLSESNITDSDNFFELGGHSLIALHLIDEVEQALQVELGGMHEMCENPTLGQFIELVAVKLRPVDN